MQEKNLQRVACSPAGGLVTCVLLDEDSCPAPKDAAEPSAACEGAVLLVALSEAAGAGSLLAAGASARLLPHRLSRASKAVWTLGASTQVFRVVFLQSTALGSCSVLLICLSAGRHQQSHL